MLTHIHGTKVINEIDDDQSGRISFYEFNRIMNRTNDFRMSVISSHCLLASPNVQEVSVFWHVGSRKAADRKEL
jgi:hypothetical protein